jgi:hypothetical protein
MDLKTKIDELLIQSRIDEAIDLLTNSVIGSVHDLHNTLIILKSRYMSNEMDNINKIISHEEYQRNKNVIINDFQNTLNLLPNEIKDHSLSENKTIQENIKQETKKPSPVKWIVISIVAGFLTIIIAFFAISSGSDSDNEIINQDYNSSGSLILSITDMDSIPIQDAQVEIVNLKEVYKTNSDGECVINLASTSNPMHCKISKSGFKEVVTDIAPEFMTYCIKLESE